MFRVNDLFPPRGLSTVAHFFCFIADSSTKPRSQFRSVLAVYGNLYSAYGLESPTDFREIKLSVKALIISETTASISKSKVMPIQPFGDLFAAWPSNHSLSIKQLRLKAIVFLVLTLMLRHSDIVPRIVTYDVCQ